MQVLGEVVEGLRRHLWPRDENDRGGQWRVEGQDGEAGGVELSIGGHTVTSTVTIRVGG